MIEIKYAGLIECGETANSSWVGGNSEFDGFQLKKVLLKQNIATHFAKEHYPKAEVVHDSNSIINDDSIELVIVSGPGDTHINLVAQALEAGKQVRVL